MHDPAFGYRSPPDVLQGAAMPTLHLLGDGFAQNDSINETTRKVAANSPRPSAVYHLLGSSHGNRVASCNSMIYESVLSYESETQ